MKWLGVLLLVKAVLGDQENIDENRDVQEKDLFEGDMRFTKEQRSRAEKGMDVDGSSSSKRGASRFRQWPYGEVYYEIDPSLADFRAMNAVNEGMEEWTTKTCIRFKKRTSESAYVLFTNGAGCSSFVGRTGRRQNITLAPGCRFRGIVAHEIGHAIGFYHEQSRPDRDDFIEIKMENIIDRAKFNFNQYPRSTIDSLGSPYDYGSLMHYGSKAFTKNGQPTIRVLTPGATIGQRQGLSPIDAKQADRLYQAECARRGGGATTLPPTAAPLPTTPGATTLPPTTAPLPTTPGNECSNYKVLNSSDRAQGNTNQNNVRCDQRDLSTPGWYRFMGAAGDQIPDACVPVRRCGTHAPGWLNGAHPTVQDGVVTRSVCYHWSNNCCRWRNNIKVKNCGGYFVYELQRTPACSLRYCGNAGTGATTLPPTTTPLPTKPANECSSYKVLSSSDRAQGNTYQNNVRCDRRDLSTPGWYRFMGAAGDQIPDACVPVRRCGTSAPGWLNGAHPTVQDGAVTRRVCYNWRNNCCRWSNNIKVKNCGGYFVYELQRTPGCSFRYCGNAPGAGSCQDNRNSCRFWSRIPGFCRFSRYAKANCKKSCRICS